MANRELPRPTVEAQLAAVRGQVEQLRELVLDMQAEMRGMRQEIAQRLEQLEEERPPVDYAGLA